jgi:hypothetical protein
MAAKPQSVSAEIVSQAHSFTDRSPLVRLDDKDRTAADYEVLCRAAGQLARTFSANHP